MSLCLSEETLLLGLFHDTEGNLQQASNYKGTIIESPVPRE